MSWSELNSIEAASGAEFGDPGEVRLPQRFDSLAAEWHAARYGAALIDARNRCLLSLVGDDRTSFLQGMVTNDVAGLAAGDGCYAALLTIQGRIVSDLYVYALDERLLLDVPAARTQAVREALERLIIADDVTFEEHPIQPLVSVEGPLSLQLLARVAGDSPAHRKSLQHRALTIDSTAVHCVAVNQTGELGFRLLGEPPSAAALWQRLHAAGAVPVGSDALNVLRLEAGIPWHGVDMDDETLVMEVGLEAAISFNKGCYLGQEVVERVAARGHVNRKLCGLTAPGSMIPAANTPLRYDDKDVGYITSAAQSPALGKIVALGYVHRSAFEMGTVLQATVSGTPLALTVSPRPFYRSASTTDTRATGGK